MKKKVAALGALSALLLAAFSTVPASAEPEGNAEKVLNVAIIGDSYTAGNGVGNHPNGNHDGSFYSLNNWGNKYVEWLNTQGVNARLVATLAYGGSVADDLLCTQTGKYRATYDYENQQCVETNTKRSSNSPGGQIENLPDDVDIVLLTVGGNDVRFSEIVTQCFAIGLRDAKTCEQNVEKATRNLNETVDYSKKNDGSDVEVSVKQKTKTILEALGNKLRPDAEVVLLSYPLLSTDRPYVLVDELFREELVDEKATKSNAYPAGAQVRALGMEAITLQQNIVDEWNKQGGEHVAVHYVGSIADAFAGHEPDPSAHSRNGDNKKKMGTHLGRWVNEFLETETREVSDGNGGTKIVSVTSLNLNNWYHPGITGHEKIAAEIAKAIGIPASTRTITSATLSSGPMDIAIVVDTSSSMETEDAGAQLTANIVQAVSEQTSSARFAVISSNQESETSGVITTSTDFTTDIDTLEEAFSSINEDDDTVAVEAGDAHSSVDEALQLDWRDDAHKVMIIIDGETFEGEATTSGYNEEDIFRLADKGIEVYAIDTQEVTVADNSAVSDDSVTNLVEATGGKTYEASTSENIHSLVSEVASDLLAKPSAWLQGDIGGYAGDELVFDAQASYSTNGDITSYEWDFDGDGTYDRATTNGRQTYSFSVPIDAVARVRVTDSEGYSAVATAPVRVVGQPAPASGTDLSAVEDKPGVSEVVDEEAVEIFPELEPVARDAHSPEPTFHDDDTSVQLPLTGAGKSTSIASILAVLFFVGGVVILRGRSK
ncbi:MAG: VWA domain-containing protein [Actinomycetaceae bacterium]|nr:VWA domain-containing protein [Actinomycetaceae bacterium]